MRELQRRGYAVAIASGDWEATARHKFQTAGIPFEGLPAAFCDVANPRTDIMRTALARAARHYGRERFDRVIYVADAAWTCAPAASWAGRWSGSRPASSATGCRRSA